MELNISSRYLVDVIGAYEPYLEDIIENEKGKLVKTISDMINMCYYHFTDDDKDYLKNKYPKINHYIDNGYYGDDLPPHEDHWEKAEVGDIVMKTGTHYESNVENGNHYVVLEVIDDSSVTILDIDGQLKSLCYPEEYKVIKKVKDAIDSKNEVIRKRSEEVNKRIKEYRDRGELFSHEKQFIKSMLKDGKSIEYIQSIFSHFNNEDQLK